ncbi:MAG: nucleotide exchange factor GrpE [Legionellales bacterium]|nr:nucleotide exchange factor GrpE [Legionellales bacterium]
MSKHTEKNWKKFKEDHEPKNEPEVEVGDEPLNEPQALGHPSYLELEEKLTDAEQQAHENWEKAVRAMAELDNVRRRSEREVASAHRYGLEKIIVSLIPVMDSLEQALQLADKHQDQGMHEGLELTMKLFLDVLKKYEVEQISPDGAVFDPSLHEAMTMQESAGVPSNTILTVFQKGYLLHDRVIRPARVIVAK